MWPYITFQVSLSCKNCFKKLKSKKTRKVWDVLTFAIWGKTHPSLITYFVNHWRFCVSKSKVKTPATKEPLLYYNVPIQSHFSRVKDEPGLPAYRQNGNRSHFHSHCIQRNQVWGKRFISFFSYLSHRSFLLKPSRGKMERRGKEDDQIQEQFLSRFTK